VPSEERRRPRRRHSRSPARPVARPQPTHPYLQGPHPRAYAHRGWHVDELAGLENTVVAFRRAVDEGFGYLELDVHATADGVAVVHHDRTLDRTTDGSGPIAARTAADLARVRVRGRHGREPIPHLADVLAALPDTRVTVELKSGAAVRPMLAVLARLDAWDRVCVAGYHEPWLWAARRLAGEAAVRAGADPATSVLFTSMAQVSVARLRLQGWALQGRRDTSRTVAPPVRGDLAQLPHRFAGVTVVDEAVLQVAHSGGREVHVWTVDDPAAMAGLLELGVDGILTDRPDLLRAVLHARGRWPAP
jgi:glycerophosphoryl diester phosphodiesterase